MRRFLYERICAQLKKELPDIKYFDLWNENMENLEQGIIFDTPAVFLEFDPISFSSVSRGVPRYPVVITLHIITRYAPKRPNRSGYAPEALQHLDLLERIERALIGLSGEGFSALQLTSAELDHNHAGLQNHIERFTTSVGYPASHGTRSSRMMIEP
ncbi:hypothetical protein [Porphyromonas catoniae]|jgi:hypothetical protein|uniref:Uncharacterized protein n=1 Tax=Porphyromonas catoniae ATCC 51270 TaxID=887901 RepID=Z4WUQ5_9PORP|nr:hypothetical protein [Porphyromonas catoniae]EWC93236.1 hypothetical protein HMPREF0636_1098 [Porphyromonas catoniae ATCC 51270]DAV05709.1 MAG TPA: hypothetical protein [Caudoviricetes sp.]